MEAKNNSTKRTFGLVSGYGSDTESEDSDQEEVVKKIKVGGREEGEEVKDYEVEDDLPQSKALSASLLRARREYEERSMLYSFICSAEQDEKNEDQPEANNEDTEKDINSQGIDSDTCNVKVTEGDAIKDDGCNEVKKARKVEDEEDVENKDNVALDNCQSSVVENHYKDVIDQNRTAVIENNDKDWEIRAIQAEIETQQKDWEPVYSDDEGTGAEDAAVFKRAKKRAVVMKDLEKESVKPMNRIERILPEGHVPGEGWKRLQLMAETRVKNFPEKYTTFPVHKFPHKDSESR